MCLSSGSSKPRAYQEIGERLKLGGFFDGVRIANRNRSRRIEQCRRMRFAVLNSVLWRKVQPVRFVTYPDARDKRHLAHLSPISF